MRLIVEAVYCDLVIVVDAVVDDAVDAVAVVACRRLRYWCLLISVAILGWPLSRAIWCAVFFSTFLIL